MSNSGSVAYSASTLITESILTAEINTIGIKNILFFTPKSFIVNIGSHILFRKCINYPFKKSAKNDLG